MADLNQPVITGRDAEFLPTINRVLRTIMRPGEGLIIASDGDVIKPLPGQTLIVAVSYDDPE